jgi:uncharacterized protein (TIGR02444 family)
MAAEFDNPFWDFSLAVWGREAVEPACLALQERHGLDVNLLLFCGWAGRRGRALGAADIERLIEAARPWRAATVLPRNGSRISRPPPRAPPDACAPGSRRTSCAPRRSNIS